MFVLIDTEPEADVSIRTRLYNIGIHSLVVPPNRLSQILYLPAFANIIPRPDVLPDLPDLVAEVRGSFPRSPCAMVSRRGLSNFYVYGRMANIVMHENFEINDLVCQLSRTPQFRLESFCYSHTGCIHAYYKHQSLVIIYGLRFPVTHTEWMILRYLTFADGRPISADELRSTCLPPNTRQCLSTLRHQIYKLNFRFNKFYRQKYVVYEPHNGYYISRI